MRFSCQLKKALTPILGIVLLTFVFTVSAASLSLTAIGSLSTEGAAYSEWWFSGVDPTISGTAGENADVVISVDGAEETVTADASGNWSYQVIGSDDTDVILTSGEESYSFTLHLGQEFPGAGSSETETTTTVVETVTEESTASVPETGYPQALGLTTGLSMVLLGVYIYLRGKRNTKEAYVKDVLDSVE